MTITQTVEIPADRRVFFEFFAPEEIPTGRAQLELKVTPVIGKNDIPISPSYINMQSTPHTDALLNIFSNIGEIDIEKIRDERLSKHLK